MSSSGVVRAVLLSASLCLACSAAQAAGSPFTAMAGAWSGGGMLRTSDGQEERLRCRASYRVIPDGTQMRLNLRCASASYKFNLAGDVTSRGDQIYGSWSEATRNASGTISGRAVGDRIEVSAVGQNFTASLSLTTRRNQQTVLMQPQGTEITSVTLTLGRR